MSGKPAAKDRGGQQETNQVKNILLSDCVMESYHIAPGPTWYTIAL